MLAPVGEITVVREGSGPEILLVHGGAGPRTTWGGIAPLADRWTLARVHRRGYPPSPPPLERQDFDVDARDLAPLLVGRPHVVAHSYGVLGTLIAAAAAPGGVRSLTLIEPPLNYLVPDDSEVARLERVGDAVLTHGMDADPSDLREFLRLVGAPIGDGPLPGPVVGGVRRAHGSRPTGEARPRLAAIRDAGVPVLVASGGHAAAFERICDALADALGGERSVHPGAGHFVAAAPGFTERLEVFLRESVAGGPALRG
jgi:pimeloyl-ACP methyl ester carboxylesterase